MPSLTVTVMDQLLGQSSRLKRVVSRVSSKGPPGKWIFLDKVVREMGATITFMIVVFVLEYEAAHAHATAYESQSPSPVPTRMTWRDY